MEVSQGEVDDIGLVNVRDLVDNIKREMGLEIYINLDHSPSVDAAKLGIDATKKLPGEGFKRPWPPLIKMDEAVRKKMDALFNASNSK